MEGKTVTATGLYLYMDYLKELNITNVLYTYETLYGTNILLEHNNTIYMVYMIEDYLEKSLHSEDNGIHIDIHPNKYYPDESGA